MADADFRQKFLTKILNPQMGILTQSQIIFWENSNFQNRLNQKILTPGEKKHFFLENPTTILTSTNILKALCENIYKIDRYPELHTPES